MTIFEAVILGVVQGVTEWLPVSSSGHLVLVQNLMGNEVPIIFYVALHMGTLAAVVAIFWSEIVGMLRAVVRRDFRSEHGRLALLVILGTIPTAIIGLLFRDQLESFFSSTFVVGIGLLITGTLVFLSRFFKGQRRIGYKDSVYMGIAQGIAIIPGVSRSGSVISAGLFRGIDRSRLVSYSFLLSIPAVMGAAIVETAGGDTGSMSPAAVIAGTLVAAVVGYAAIKLLIRAITQGRFYWFAFYAWAVGLIALIAT